MPPPPPPAPAPILRPPAPTTTEATAPQQQGRADTLAGVRAVPPGAAPTGFQWALLPGFSGPLAPATDATVALPRRGPAPAASCMASRTETYAAQLVAAAAAAARANDASRGSTPAPSSSPATPAVANPASALGSSASAATATTPATLSTPGSSLVTLAAGGASTPDRGGGPRRVGRRGARGGARGSARGGARRGGQGGARGGVRDAASERTGLEGERNGLAGYPTDLMRHCDQVETAARAAARRRVDHKREAEAAERVPAANRDSTPSNTARTALAAHQVRVERARAAACAAALQREAVPEPVALVDEPVLDDPAAMARPAGAAAGPAATAPGRAAAPAGPGTGGAGNGTGSMGNGRAWTTLERVALCEAYKLQTLDALNGTSQTANTLWAKVWFAFASRTPPNLSVSDLRGRWSNRALTSAKTEFQRNIAPCTQRFAHFYHVASTQLTGNMNEESVLRAARCLYTATGAYAAERRDIDYEKVLQEQGKASPVRRACLLPENWQPYWKVLRTMDKWSGASATPEMEKLFLNDTDDDCEESGIESDCVTAADGTTPKRKRIRRENDSLQARPVGRKAAKRAAKTKSRGEEDAPEASLAASDEAMRSIAQSMARKADLADAAYQVESRREAIDLFNRPENRQRDERKQFRSMMMRRMVNLGRAVTQHVIHGRTTTPTEGAPTLSTAVGAMTSRNAGSRSGGASSAVDRARGANAMATKTKNAQAVANAQSVDLTTPPNGRAPANTRGAERSASKGGGRNGPADSAELAGELDDEEKADVADMEFDSFPAEADGEDDDPAAP